MLDYQNIEKGRSSKHPEPISTMCKDWIHHINRIVVRFSD